MTRTAQIARAVETICLTTEAHGQVGIYIDDERFDVSVITSARPNEHVWDCVTINGIHCGNRHGGVRFLLIALGVTDAQDAFADREAIAYRAARKAEVAS